MRPALHPLRFALSALLLAGQSFAQTPAAPDFHSNPKFQKAEEDAKVAKPGKDALSAWKKANKAANGACVECLHAIVAADLQLSKFKDLAADGDQLAAIATTPTEKFYAAAEGGTGYLLLDLRNPKPKNLEDADQHFRAALALGPHSTYVLFQEGRTLALLNRDADAKAMFAEYVKSARPGDRYLRRAQHFAANPHLAAMPSAPPFAVRTVDGQPFSLDQQNGKVVLVDFWASWCGPCRETIPELKAMTEKFAGQPLTVISVSIDEDDGAWRKAMKTEGMTWTQYRDTDGTLQTIYGVTAIPRFFAIDSDGILREAKLGAGNDIEGMVSKLLKEARDAEAPLPSSSAPAGK